MHLEQIDQAVLDFCKGLNAKELAQLPFRKLPFVSPEPAWILKQATLYQLAKAKATHWWERGDLIFPDRTALEQSTHPLLSQWKSHFFGRFPWVWDVCSGLGIDASILGRTDAPICLTEPDAERAACLAYNFKKLGFQSLQVVAEPWSPDAFPGFNGPGLVLADPDRRPELGKRRNSWRDSSPDVEAIFHFAQARKCRLLVKFSPLDDPDEIKAAFPGMETFFFLSFHNELKELGGFWDFSKAVLPLQPRLLGVECRSDGRFTEQTILVQPDRSWVSPQSNHFLLDPWVAFRRKSFGVDLQQFPEISALHPETRLFITEQLPTGFPGRIFQIDSVHSQLKEAAQMIPDRNCHVVARHYPAQPEEIRKKFKWTEKGERYLFCLGLPDAGPVFLVTSRCPEAFSVDFWKKL